jgi:diguanylate cyclase (GGDEF)-like protein
MPHPLLRGFGRRTGSDPAPEAPAGAPERRPAAPPPQAMAALDLARELLRGAEHFVLSTPDLDTPGFLDRLRRVAARLTGTAEPGELEGHRQWAAESLSAFGQLQRRYLSEREDELWRLLTLYQEHQKVDGAANNQFQEAIRGVHERMGNVVRLDDLRQVRERLESELQRAALVSARHEALRDALTGVYHRGGFEAQVEAALRAPAPCSLAMIDVDSFKGINDSLGHLVGDQILRISVELLSKVARPGDVIGRFGGDEFCLLAPGVAPERLRDRFGHLQGQRHVTFQHEERHCSVRLSFSVGIAGSQPGDTVSTLTQRADTALYEVKRNGKAHARVAPA